MIYASLALIAAMKKIAEETNPITGRGTGYKLFAAGLIDSVNDMNVVYRALKIAREEGTIPWAWIVDETRELELVNTWRDPSQCADGFFYRRDLWQTQPKTVEVWSEKGTVRDVLWPVLARLGVGFRVLHGFSSATTVWDVSNPGKSALLADISYKVARVWTGSTRHFVPGMRIILCNYFTLKRPRTEQSRNAGRPASPRRGRNAVSLIIVVTCI